MSVDLPAPFSPSSACTSPPRRSKSTRSLATRAPKRLVTPLSSSASGVAVSLRALLDRVGDVRQLAGRDPLGEVVDSRLVLAAHGVDLAEAHAAGVHVEDRVAAGLEGPVRDLLGGGEDGFVDLLQRGRHHVIAEIALVR